MIPTVKPQLFFEIKAELDPTLGEFAPSFTTMTEMVKKIYKMVLDDGRLKVRELADMVGISKSAVHRILTENLCMRKLCASCSPNLSTSDYFLFLNLKKWLSGQRFANNEDMDSAVNGFFDLDGSHYKHTLKTSVLLLHVNHDSNF